MTQGFVGDDDERNQLESPRAQPLTFESSGLLASGPRLGLGPGLGLGQRKPARGRAIDQSVLVILCHFLSQSQDGIRWRNRWKNQPETYANSVRK